MSSGSDGNDFTAIIVAAGVAQIMRTLQFAAVRAFLERFDAQRIVAAAHTATGRGRFPLGDSHVGTLFRK